MVNEKQKPVSEKEAQRKDKEYWDDYKIGLDAEYRIKNTYRDVFKMSDPEIILYLAKHEIKMDKKYERLQWIFAITTFILLGLLFK